MIFRLPLPLPLGAGRPAGWAGRPRVVPDVLAADRDHRVLVLEHLAAVPSGRGSRASVRPDAAGGLADRAMREALARA